MTIGELSVNILTSGAAIGNPNRIQYSENRLKILFLNVQLLVVNDEYSLLLTQRIGKHCGPIADKGNQILLILFTILLRVLLLIVTSPIRPWTSVRPFTLWARAGRFWCWIEILALWEGGSVLVGGVCRQDCRAVRGVLAGHRVPGRLARVQAAHLPI